MRAASVVSVETRREFNEKFKIPAAQYQQKYLNKITTRFFCFICDKELDPYGPDMHADHIVPKEWWHGGFEQFSDAVFELQPGKRYVADRRRHATYL
jgi:hypothetical protein